MREELTVTCVFWHGMEGHFCSPQKSDSFNEVQMSKNQQLVEQSESKS